MFEHSQKAVFDPNYSEFSYALCLVWLQIAESEDASEGDTPSQSGPLNLFMMRGTE